ncbi:MAG: FdtA/QdtA family cupin domain-containing protein [Synergistaceae bacterium]|jgi:dTDP-4-dehydrorhamnose 3,5-epimerase-like enzyme|nr:FdtA/QdtA family cupin domain-containing protein [Synergistaceae bacterium]
MLTHSQVIVHQNAKLCVLEGALLPFEVRRVYCICGVAVGATRGFHAHKTLEQLLTAPAGRIDVETDDGRGNKELYVLDSPEKVLYVGPSSWHTMTWRSEAVLMVMASQEYDPGDYIRGYEEFLAFAAKERSV